MFGIDDQQCLIADLAIGCHLPRQALQVVGSSLDFDTSDVAVDHGDIDPAAAVVEAKFVNDQGVGTSLGHGLHATTNLILASLRFPAPRRSKVATGWWGHKLSSLNERLLHSPRLRKQIIQSVQQSGHAKPYNQMSACRRSSSKF